MIDLYGHLGTEPTTLYAVPQRQRDVHVRSEALALIVAVPFLVYVAALGRPLVGWEKAGVLGLAGATLLIDGWLFSQWRKNG